MRLFFRLLYLFVFFLSGCVSMEVAREVQSGRIALQKANPKGALPHFEAAARLNPDYVTDFTPLDVGIWTYIGRAYYEIGEKEKALVSLRRARDHHGSDYIGRLYLGLLMAQNGKREEGLAELDSGLKGLKVWLETLPSGSDEGRYWDPGGYLGNAISQTLTVLQAREINWTEVGANVEWLGKEFDEEIDEAHLHMIFDLEGEQSERTQ